MGARIFRALLHLLPGDFRSEFGDVMRADAHRGDARWWTREIPGLLAAIVREHAAASSRDVRESWRLLRRTPGFTLTAIIMLAAGTGANAAVFSVVDAVLLRPAFPDPDRLVTVGTRRPDDSISRTLSLADFRALAASPLVAGAAGLNGHIDWVERNGETKRIDTDCVSRSFFSVLGVQPAVGRAFAPDEDRAGAVPVAIISDRMWRRDFAASTEVLGRTLTIGRASSTIIGVMPPGFLGAHGQNNTEIWVPLEPSLAGQIGAPCGPSARLSVVARLRAGMPLALADTQLSSPGARLHVDRLDDETFDAYRTPLFAMMATTACVLLIACANVSNLQIERLSSRRRELAVRIALGATRWRIIRQTLTENVLLAVAGSAAGLGVAAASLRWLVAMAPPQMPHVGDIALNARALTMTSATAIAAGVVVGLVPASLLSSGRTPTVSGSARGIRGGSNARRWIVAGEVALSVALLIAAGLMTRSFVALRPSDLGFDPSQRYIAETMLPDDARSPAGRVAFSRAWLDELRRIDGVASASASTYMPLRGYTETADVAAGAEHVTAWTAWVTDGFVEDVGATLVSGRSFDETDIAGSDPVALVNETLARQMFGGHAAGQTIVVRTPERLVTRRVVGVVADMREGGRDTVRRPELYAPYEQGAEIDAVYVVVRLNSPRTAALGPAIRAAAKRVRAGQLLDFAEPMDATVARGFARARFGASLFGAFALIALALAGLGLAAVMAWWVSERRGEIGVRMALGATRGAAARLVAREGAMLALAGTAAGVAASLVGARLLREWLFGISPVDPLTLACSAGGFLCVAALATYLPARRAARIDPAITLRTE